LATYLLDDPETLVLQCCLSRSVSVYVTDLVSVNVAVCRIQCGSVHYKPDDSRPRRYTHVCITVIIEFWH